jgi:hypothetical protein
MTKSFSSLVAVLAISASLTAVTTPVSAFTATDDLSRVGGAPAAPVSAGSITRVPPIANGDLGSGRDGDGATGRGLSAPVQANSGRGSQAGTSTGR